MRTGGGQGGDRLTAYAEPGKVEDSSAALTGDTGMHGHSSHHGYSVFMPCRLRAPTPKLGTASTCSRACGHHFAFVHAGSLDC